MINPAPSSLRLRDCQRLLQVLSRCTPLTPSSPPVISLRPPHYSAFHQQQAFLRTIARPSSAHLSRTTPRPRHTASSTSSSKTTWLLVAVISLLLSFRVGQVSAWGSSTWSPIPRSRPVLIEEDSGDDDDDACVASDLDEAFSARTRTVTKSVKRKEEKGSADRKHSFIADAVEKAMGAVVNISVETETSTLLHKNSLISSGSGFFIDADGSILTNAHVVTDMGPGGTLTVTTSDGAHYPGRIHSLDTLSDLAVVKIAPRTRAPSDPPTTSGTASATSWPVLQMSTNIDLRRGDWVVAIGSPFGLHNTVTAGVVSSHRRRSDEIGYLGVPGPNTTEHHQSDAHPVEYIQTDCVVHEGSSGGPLLNLDGDVVGINTTRAESEGISFAIRADNAMELVHQLNTQGRVVRPFLGARMVSLSAHVRQQLRDQVPSRPSHGRSAHATPPSIHQDHGVLVTTVLPDAPCARAGMMDGDVVVAVNGRPCHSTRELYAGVGSEMKEAIFSVRRNVPLDMDWDGRSTRWETLELEIGVKPEELDG